MDYHKYLFFYSAAFVHSYTANHVTVPVQTENDILKYTDANQCQYIQ